MRNNTRSHDVVNHHNSRHGNLFKPLWMVQNKQSSYPINNNHQTRQCGLVSPNSNQIPPIHPVYLNHLRHQLPQFKKSPINIKLSSKQIKNYDEHHCHDVDDFIIAQRLNTKHFYQTSSDDTFNITNNKSFEKVTTRNKSVKNVIEKFNRLSKIQTEQTTHSNNYNKNNNNNNKTLECIFFAGKSKFNHKNQIRETDNYCCDNNNNNNKKQLLRCEKMGLISNECVKNKQIIYDELLEIFKPPLENNMIINTLRSKLNNFEVTPRNTLDNLQLSKTERKQFHSIETQTSPQPSGTNILINVFNTPSPHTQIMQLKISKEKLNFVVSEEEIPDEHISTATIEEDLNVTKSNVKNCIDRFEEHLKKTGLENEDNEVTTKKIKDNYLLKGIKGPELSPRAKTVPF